MKWESVTDSRKLRNGSAFGAVKSGSVRPVSFGAVQLEVEGYIETYISWNNVLGFVR